MSQSHQRRRAWAASLGGHLAVLLALGLASGEVHVGGHRASNVSFDPQAVATLSDSDSDSTAIVAGSDATEQLPIEATFAGNSEPQPELTPETPLVGDLVRQQLDRAQREADAQSADKKLSDLEAAAKKLAVISNEKSVDAISQTLNKALNVPAPPEVDSAKPAKFDISSAQIVDVREETRNDKLHYFALMEDRHKLQEEVEVDADTGQQLAKTFGLIKKFPLLESVYRKTVIGLLNKMLADQSNARSKPKTLATPESKPEE